MAWLVLTYVCYVLSYSTVPVAGQCTVYSCAVSLAGSEESLQVSLEEHGHRLETMNQNMCSALEKLETAVNRTNARGQEELCQGLKTLYHNISFDLEKVSGKIPVKTECPAMQKQEEYLNSMNLNLTSMIVRTDERVQAVNENLTYVYKNLRSTLQTVNRSLEEKLHVMQVHLSSLMNKSFDAVLREIEAKFQTLNKTLPSAVDNIIEELNATLDNVEDRNQSLESQDYCQNTSVVCDCSDIKANGYTTSGVYLIYVVDQGERYYANASCDMTTTNGGWTVFQRRKDGSVDFYRDWNDYENGFGNLNGEFWLGNNFLHLLTSKRRYRLRIDLEDFEGERRYAEYSTFRIGSSANRYYLIIRTYSGTAGDSLGSNSYYLSFTTKDHDNDRSFSRNCAIYRSGAWWYDSCSSSNLNGLYLRGQYSSNGSFNGREGIQWYPWRYHWYSLKTTEMKISSF